MSGPVTTEDAPDSAAPRPQAAAPETAGIEVLEGRQAEVGGFGVRRVLPRRQRRSVGAWCFVDHMGPATVTDGHGLDIGPHPHIGLQTVTWLLDGALLHRDSLGSEQLVRPGQLNLMTAGHGVAHAEESSGVHRGALHGVQLWVAQPAATRDGPPAFEHHGELPRVEVAGGAATVLVGTFLQAASPARCDTEHFGAELELGAGRTVLPLHPGMEHGVVVLAGVATAAGERLEPGRLGYAGTGRDELVLDCDGPARVLLLGGTPFPEPLLMWWNYVARTRDEITAAHREWSQGSGRFGDVASPLARIEVPGPSWAPGG